MSEIKVHNWSAKAVARFNLPTKIGSTFEWESKKHGTVSTHKINGVGDDGSITTTRVKLVSPVAV